jgi:hypothetical protein
MFLRAALARAPRVSWPRRIEEERNCRSCGYARERGKARDPAKRHEGQPLSVVGLERIATFDSWLSRDFSIGAYGKGKADRAQCFRESVEVWVVVIGEQRRARGFSHSLVSGLYLYRIDDPEQERAPGALGVSVRLRPARKGGVVEPATNESGRALTV